MPIYRVPIDLAQNELRNAVIQNLAGAPATPRPGQVYYDTGTNTLVLWNGTAWSPLATGSVAAATATSEGIVQLAGDLGGTAAAPTVTGLHLAGDAAINHKLTNVTDPTLAQDAATKNYVDGRSLSNFGAPTADLSIGTHKLINVATPTAATDGASKGYVDGVAQGLSVKGAVVAATTGGETYTIAGGSVTQITGLNIDGVAPAVGDRILIKNAPAASGAGAGAGTASTSQPANGIYTVTGNVTNLTVQRAADMSGANNPAGAFTFIEGGAQGSSGYVVSSPTTPDAAFVYGTNAIAWTQFSGAGEITAGTGLTKNGNTLALATPVAIANGGTGSTTATAARTALGAGAVYTSTITGDGATTTFNYTPPNPPTTNGAWNVALINQSTGAVEIADVSVNQSANTPNAGPVNQIQVRFSTAPANGTNYSLVVQG